MKSDVKLTTSGAETLTKISNYLHQGLNDSRPCFLRDTIEKIQERNFIFCKLVGVSAALGPVKMALLESESEQSCCVHFESCTKRTWFQY